MTPLNFLLVQGEIDNGHSIIEELKLAGFDLMWKRVEAESDFVAELKNSPDVIISVSLMPRFSGLQAAKLLQASGLNIPFILISSIAGEYAAVEAMKTGVSDYLLKDRIVQLGAAVKHALEKKSLCDERGRMQKQLHLQSTALQAAANAIVITDRTGDIQWVNPAFVTLSGYTAEEVIGKNPRIFKSGKQDAAFYRDLWKTILSGQTWRGEIINRRKDGTFLCDEHTITPVRSESGEISHFIAIMHDLTERLRAEESLKLFRALIDRSNDGIEVIDPATGRFLDINATTCEQLGYTREELLTMTVMDLDEKAVSPASWPEVVEEIRRDGFKIIEGQHRRKNGSVFPVEVNVRFITLDRDYLIAAVRDITERKHAEEALHESEIKFRQITENIHEVFWISDPTANKIIYVSPAYEKIWGRTCESLYQSHDTWMDAIHPEDKDRIRNAWNSQQSPGNYQEEFRILRPDGSLRWIHEKAFPIKNEAGEVYRIAGVSEDITQRRDSERAALRSQRLEAIGTLASGVAHDLNNALAPIMMGVEILKLEFPGQSQVLDMFQTSAKRGAEMVRQLLTFAKGAEGERISIQPLHLVREMHAMMRGSFPKNIQLVLRCDSKLSTVSGDATQLHQTLLNLCVNARDAMPDGGTLTLEAKEIEIDSAYASAVQDARPGRYVKLQICDTGTGIPQKILDRIFEPFFTTKGPEKGTGLGLSTVMGIVKGHGGFLHVYSQVGRGSKFCVYLPAELTSHEAESTPKTEEEFRGNGEMILLVDDEVAVRNMARAVLRRLNFEPLTAIDGADGLIKAAENKTELCAVITDLHMPNMDGFHFVRALRRMLPNIPVVMASGQMSEAIAEEFAALTRAVRLDKPFTKDQLAEALKKLLVPPAQDKSRTICSLR